MRRRSSRRRRTQARIPQPRFNEVEQARDAATIRFDDAASDGPHPLTFRRVSQQARQCSRQFSRIRDLERSTLRNEQARNVVAGKVRGPGQHGQSKRRRLEQIVAADRYQAPADESHIARGIKRTELAHRVDQHHLRGAARLDPGAAPREAHRCAAQRIRHGFEPIRMPRHQQQQSIRLVDLQPLVGCEHLLLLARVRAAGNPYRPRTAQ